MLRKHKLFKVVYDFRQQIRESDGAGGSDFVAWSPTLTRNTVTIIAPSVEHATVWAADYIKYAHDGQVVDIVEGEKITAYIEAHDY